MANFVVVLSTFFHPSFPDNIDNMDGCSRVSAITSPPGLPVTVLTVLRSRPLPDLARNVTRFLPLSEFLPHLVEQVFQVLGIRPDVEER